MRTAQLIKTLEGTPLLPKSKPEDLQAAWVKNLQSMQQQLKQQNVRLPAAIVDMDAFERNLQKAANSVKGTKQTIRVATKSLRTPELIKKVLDHGSPFQGLMCYSVEEAAFLNEKYGFDDLLIAYPTVQKSDVALLQQMTKRGVSVSLIIDSEEQMQAIQNHWQQAPVVQSMYPNLHSDARLKVMIEMDMSYRLGPLKLGAKRSPISSNEELRVVLTATKKYPFLQVQGVMGYEAVVAGMPDRSPYQRILNPVKSFIRNRAVKQIAAKRAAIPGIFAEVLGSPPKVFNGGGTGSLNFAVKEQALTEVTMGSGLLCPARFDGFSNLNKFPEFHFEPAAYFATQVSRFPDANTVTVNGGGYVASGDAGKQTLPVPVFPPNLKLTDDEGAGEVQTPLKLPRRMPPEYKLSVGDPVLFRHAKAGELAEQINQYNIFRGGKLEEKGEMETYRGMGKKFGQ